MQKQEKQHTKYRENKKALESDQDFRKYLREKFYIIGDDLYMIDERMGPNKNGLAKMVPGTLRNDKYVMVSVGYEGTRHAFYKHRIMYFLWYGNFPEYIDHIDRDPSNNSKSNLRSCSAAENQLNCYQSQYARGRIPFIGVGKCGNKFRAYIKVETIFHHIGMYDTAEEAALARDKYVLDNNLTDRYRLNFEEQ